MSTIVDRDHGYQAILRRIGDAAKGRKVLQVGIQGEAAAEAKAPGTGEEEAQAKDATTVGMIAAFAELGLGQPERSWLRGWYDLHEEEIKEDLRKVARGAIEGRYTEERGLELLGVKYVGQIQQRIAQGINPPNAPSTIARKKSSTPLVDTGQLRSAVTYLLSQAK